MVWKPYLSINCLQDRNGTQKKATPVSSHNLCGKQSNGMLVIAALVTAQVTSQFQTVYTNVREALNLLQSSS